MLRTKAAWLSWAKSTIDTTKSLIEILTFSVAIFSAIYAFLYPGDVAKKVATFQEMIEDARTDVAAIRDNTEAIKDNTGGILDNTSSIQSSAEKIAAAIPSWVRVEAFHQSFTRYGGIELWLENPSPHPLDVKITYRFSNGTPDITGQLQVMPGEKRGFSESYPYAPNTGILLCMEGSGPGLKSGAFYERRSIDWPEYDRIIQDLTPIEGCKWT